MKSTTQFLFLVVVGVLTLLVLGSWQPQPVTPALAQVQAQSPVEIACSKDRSVQVSGAAVINVIPDRAMIQLGVQSNGVTPDSVQNTNFQAIQRVTAALRALNIEAKDIATDYYYVMPVYEDYNALAIKGYRINNTVSVTLRDITLADDAIIAALKAGANEVQDVQFYTSELRKYRDQARDLAMKAAGEKAQALAGAAGAQAGCVLSISENSWAQYYGSWRGGRETAMWAQNVLQNAAPTGAETGSKMDDSPISLGQIAVRAEVSASYALK